MGSSFVLYISCFSALQRRCRIDSLLLELGQSWSLPSNDLKGLLHYAERFCSQPQPAPQPRPSGRAREHERVRQAAACIDAYGSETAALVGAAVKVGLGPA